jgi:hypothetical protein
LRTPIRYAGYLVLAVAAGAVFVVLRPKIDTITPTLPTATSYESLITSALDADTANNLRTEGAPQQQVVNGWTAKDLLTIIAKENIDILKAQGAVVDATGALNTTPFDERIPALLLIGVLALCWTGLSMPAASASASPATSAATPVGPFMPQP